MDGRLGAVWPFIGREDELEQLLAARAAARCPGAVISGAAGVGKSRLARELLAAAAAAGAATAWVPATRTAASIPLGAFAGIVPDAVRSDDRLQLLRGAVDALHQRAGGRPLVVGVDDAQLLDEVSAALVLQLASTETAFVAVTVRAGEACPDAVVALWKDAGALRLELQQLSEDELGALLEAALGGPVEQAARRWLFRSSDGNPLYARELVADALEGDGLVADHGLWRLRRRPAPGAALVELISGRMAGLDDRERGALELLALGEPLPLDLVLGITGSAPLAAAEARDLIAVDAPTEGGAVRLAHPVYGEVLRASLSTIRATELRLALAAALRERGLEHPGDALRVATWLHEAGAPIDTPLLLTAAQEALGGGDPALAARLAERARHADGGYDAAMLLARALVALKRHEEAEALLAELEPAVPGGYAALGYIWERAVNVLCWGLKRPDDARDLLDRALGWEGGTDEWRRMLAPMRLVVTALTDGWAAMVALGEEILADPGLDPEMRRQLVYGHAGALHYVGRSAEALALAETVELSIPLRDDFDDQTLVIWAVIQLESGRRWPQMRARLEALEAEAVARDDRLAQASTALMLAGVAVLEGRPRVALRWAGEAVARLERRDRAGLLPTAHAVTALAHRLDGDAEAAAAALARCEAALGPDGPLVNQAPYVLQARAAAAAAAGEASRAQELLLDAADQLRDGPGYESWMLYEAVRAGAPAREIAPRLAAAAGNGDAPLAAAQAAHVEAIAAGDADALLAAGERLEAIGAVLWAAEAFAQGAAALAAEGRADSARRAAAASARLRADSGAAPTAALAAASADAPDLTRREQEIAALAARGATNAEIAERLVLSVRTVETHLYRAMQKLGVGDRRELAGALPAGLA